MSSITIHMKLLSGDLVPVTVRARQGVARFATIRPTLEKAVLAHLELKEQEYDVVLCHPEQEAVRAQIRREDVDAYCRKQFKRPATEEDHALHATFILDMAASIRLTARVEKALFCREGDVLCAITTESPDWSSADLDDDEDDYDEDALFHEG